MANNKLKAYVRYDGTGRIIPGSLILNRFKPKVGNWQEIDANECCNYAPTNTFNFDITANWSLTTPEVVDEASFRTFLESGYDGQVDVQNNLTDVVITNFSLVDGRLQCNLSAIGGFLGLGSLQVITVNSCGNITGSLELSLSSNPIVTFDPVQPLPSGLVNLILGDTLITSFNPSIALPSGLTSLAIISSPLITFNPLIPLPNSLVNLSLTNNQIITFDPTLPLPNSLQSLRLYNNQIVTFNPSIALPSLLEQLDLAYNQIVTFNPSIALPNSLEELSLSNNNMTTAGYTASESWANAMSVIPARGDIYFGSNVNSASGTNLQTILTAKGWTVNV